MKLLQEVALFYPNNILMNPSARGWINKLLKSLFDNEDYSNKSVNGLYSDLRDSGFIYGSSIKVVNDYVNANDFTLEECSKVNLLIALNCVYKNANLKISFEKCLTDFYLAINQYKTTLFEDLIGKKESVSNLERIIHRRVQIDPNFLTKNFNYFVTNALLFIDVLAFIKYIEEQTISEAYLKNLEATIEALAYKVLNSKTKKNKYDDNLMALIEASLRYQDFSNYNFSEAIKNISVTSERKYFFDIACMTTWSDHLIDVDEHHYLLELGKELKLTEDQIESAMEEVHSFYTKNKSNIALLSSKNVVKNFYDNSSRMVSKLLTRNGKRLQRELNESKEVMRLISQSTIRDLTQEEQKQLQEQLLDIFKTIPSLAIFMLPGGALLLPLVVKYIPKLLPSSFDDNRIEK